MDISEKTLQLKQDFDDVYNAGKKSQYDEFWDNLQAYGNLGKYNYLFSYCRFHKDSFKPKYPLNIIDGDYAFAYQRLSYNPQIIGELITDLIQVCKDNNVVIDTSKATSITGMFYASEFTTIPTISFESLTGAINSVFYGNQQLETIEKLIFKADGSNTFSKNSWELPFSYCTKLKNVVVEGVIGDSLSLADCPLTEASIRSFVAALSSASTGKTVTFKKTAKENAFTTDEWDALIKTKPNWTFSLV